MATKPMRTAVGRGQNRKATVKALGEVNSKSYQSRNAANGGKGVQWSEYYGKAAQEFDRNQKANKLLKESSRIKKAGERLARVQTAAKTKRGK